MVFRSFTPQEFDAETGLTPPGHNSVNSLTGIYAVKEVTHSFSAGEFTQSLHGIRDVTINLSDVNLDGDVSDNEGGEYNLTISEFDFTNLPPTALTTGSDGSLIATPVDVSSPISAQIAAGFDLSGTNSSGTFFSPDDLTPGILSGVGNKTGGTQNFPVGQTQPEDDG
jgi:hypothetical protein